MHMEDRIIRKLPKKPKDQFESHKWVGPGPKDYEVKQYIAGQNLYLRERESEHENNNKQ